VSAGRDGRRFHGPPEPSGALPSASQPESVFISYSPEDVKFLNMLMPHLNLLENQRSIRIFTHEALPPGTLWQEVTQVAISNAAAAILLVTPDYLASRALMKDQLPYLLARAEEKDRTAILPLLVKPSLFHTLPHLYRFKPFNSTPKTLIEMRPAEKGRFLVAVAEAVLEEVRRRQAGSAGDLQL
jgi:TIR domain-containing protein